MTNLITPQAILAAVPGHPEPLVAAAALARAATRYGITSPKAVAMLLAQLGHESGILPAVENLNYSADRLAAVWPHRYAQDPGARVKRPNALAQRLAAAGPEAIANNCYSGRMGNAAPGDGWLYRGRGYIQITGRDMYRQVGQALGVDLAGHPELLLQHDVSALAACEFLKRKGLLPAMDRGDVRAVTLGINGGLNGLPDREGRYARVLGHLQAAAPMLAKPAPAQRVFLTHDTGRRDLWDGQPAEYGGKALDAAFIGRLVELYPPPTPERRHGDLYVTVAEDGAVILRRA